jgi:hypothetical protein
MIKKFRTKIFVDQNFVHNFFHPKSSKKFSAIKISAHKNHPQAIKYTQN